MNEITPNPDPEVAFSEAERELIHTVVQASNDAIRGSDLTPHRAATILRVTANCVEDNAP